MKSAYYTAVSTNAYRMAVDSYFSGNYEYNPAWREELESVSHRSYNTGYYFTDSHEDANIVENNGYIKDKAFLAVAVGYDAENGIAEFTQRNKMTLTDDVVLLTPGKTAEPITVTALYDENMTPIDSTPHPYMKFFMRTDRLIRPGDIIRAK